MADKSIKNIEAFVDANNEGTNIVVGTESNIQTSSSIHCQQVSLVQQDNVVKVPDAVKEPPPQGDSNNKPADGERGTLLSISDEQQQASNEVNVSESFQNQNSSSELTFNEDVSIGVELVAVQQQQPTDVVKQISDTLQKPKKYIEKEVQSNVPRNSIETGLKNEFMNQCQLASETSSLVAPTGFEQNANVIVSAIAAIKGENNQVTGIGFVNGDQQSHSKSSTLTVEGNSSTLNQPETENNKEYPKLFSATTAQEAHEIIKKYAEETMTTFVSMRKMKQYGITEGGIDLAKKNYRVFFESSDVVYDGVPYVYVADKMYICHLGKDKTEVTRQKIRQQSLERRAKLGLPLKDLSTTRLRTKKIDCPVKITVKMIAKFPQFRVYRKTKRVCETASKKVRQALLETNGQLNCYYSFIGRLPDIEEHNHAVGEGNADHEPIDPQIKDKIIQLTWEGLPNSTEVKKALENFVEFELFAGKTLPAKTRRRYYPNVKDIRNYMNKAKMLSRLSTDIKVELKNLGTKLQETRPTENIFLQSEVMKTSQNIMNIKTESNQPTLLFCHQTSQQQRLLKRYGNQVMLCEITNLIERVPFPLFCLFVQTNVDYQLIASFVVEVRNKESIAQALTLVKDWNPGWTPKYFIADYSDEECEAIKSVFPACQQFISDISREKSWRHWLMKAENKINGDPNHVFVQFQAIANAYNEEILHLAALQLENSEVWRESPNLRSWFNSNWLLEAKRWVVGYRPDDFIVTLHNESTIDQDIRSLRAAHIEFMRGKKLAPLIERLVNNIIPDFYRRYIELNRKSHTQANELKVLYGDQLPTCLVNKPANVIVHVLEQIKSTEATIYQVSHVQPGVFWVQDATCETTETPHTVSFGDTSNLPSCDCLDWQRYKLPCKHLCSVFTSFPDWGWDMLNSLYTGNSLINLDYSCIKPWVDTPEKQAGKLSHFNMPASMNLKATDGKNTKSKITCGNVSFEKEDATVSNDIKISGVELEVPMVSKDVESVVETTVDVMEGEVDGEDPGCIAGQCRDLLTNLAHLSSRFGKNDHIERLKADLEASIGMFQQTIIEETATRPTEDKTLKRFHEDNPNADDALVVGEDENIKKLRIDLERSDSDMEGSYVSENEQVGIPVDVTTDIEDETIEISSEQVDDEEEAENKLENHTAIEILNEDVPMETILTNPPAVYVEQLSKEQRERKLLNILTASSN